MKTAIIYATTRNEATEKIVSWMEETLKELGDEVIKSKAENFSDFTADRYIIGTAVYAFSVKRAGIGKFLKQQKNALSGKKINAFLVCGADPLPPKENDKSNGLVRFLKETFLSPEKYLKKFTKLLPETPVKTMIFKGYSEEKDKLSSGFENRKKEVEMWIKSL